MIGQRVGAGHPGFVIGRRDGQCDCPRLDALPDCVTLPAHLDQFGKTDRVMRGLILGNFQRQVIVRGLLFGNPLRQVCGRCRQLGLASLQCTDFVLRRQLQPAQGVEIQLPLAKLQRRRCQFPFGARFLRSQASVLRGHVAQGAGSG